MLTLIYDTLFWPDLDNIPQSWLVRDFETSTDGKKWTLRLHENVRWHDGKPVTAEDVKFTFEYLQKNPFPRFTAELSSIQSVVADGTYTVSFLLRERDATFAMTPLADVPIIPKHLWDNVTKPREFTGMPIGSGPYKLVEFRDQQLYRFRANEEYFKGRPVVDELIIVLIREPSTTFLAFKNGEVDGTSINLGPELVSDFERLPGVKIIKGPGFRTQDLYFNNQRYPFNVTAFRKAIPLALDNDQLVNTLLLGFGVPGSPGFVHPAIPWANPNLRHEGDPTKAKGLLDGLDFKDRDGDGVRETPSGKRLEFGLVVRANDPLAVRAAELTAQRLKDVSIRVNVVALEPGTAGNRIWPDSGWPTKGSYDMGIQSWAPTIMSEPNWLRALFYSDPNVGTLNRAGYTNREFDALADEQLRTLDVQKRYEIVRRMQQIIANDVPALPLFYSDNLIPIRADVYDGWTYLKGVGILHKLSFLAPATRVGGGIAPEGGLQQVLPVIIAAIAVAASIAYYLTRVRKGRGVIGVPR